MIIVETDIWRRVSKEIDTTSFLARSEKRLDAKSPLENAYMVAIST